tara:strand:- start:960 stop:1139 length:180 start_codon:yes stop_codon:yes gene_type:complete
MKIEYITMSFPVPTQTFTSFDIKAMKDKGNKVSVYSLGPKHKKYKNYVINISTMNKFNS